MVASGHKKQYPWAGWLLQNEVVMKGTGCVTTAVKKHYDFRSFTLFYEIMYFLKCFLIIVLTFTYVLLKCTESQYIVVLELGNVAWLHVYSQLHRVVGE